MYRLTDQELIRELEKRFEENRQKTEALQDLTEQLKDVNEKLSRSESLKSHFLSNIRNEINNPLTAILGWAANLMGDKKCDRSRVVEAAGMIHEEAFSLDFQLRTIFAAAEIEAGAAYPHIVRIDIDKLLWRVIDLFMPTAEKKRISVVCRTEYPEDENNIEKSFFYTDGEKLHLVIAHLLSNGLEFSEEGSTISIDVCIANGELRFCIEDEGKGIDPHNQERIFDRFVQLDEGITKRHKGHGLGLSLVRDAVDLLYGTIDIASSPGSGSVFTVTLPEHRPANDDEIVAIASNEEIF